MPTSHNNAIVVATLVDLHDQPVTTRKYRRELVRRLALLLPEHAADQTALLNHARRIRKAAVREHNYQRPARRHRPSPRKG